jgi:hypothetical protein
MCTKRTDDPLGKLMFAKYGMHVLSRPRENVPVFQVFAVSGGEVFLSGDVDAFLRAKFEKPDVEKGERVLDIEGTTSAAVTGETSLNFLQGFLALLGVGVATAVSAGLKKAHTRALRFRFGGCTRDSVKNGFALEWKLSNVPFEKENSAMKDGYRYFIATGVHTCKQLTFEALDKTMTKIDMSADVANLGGAKAGLTINKDGQITAASDKVLVYGVELNEIVHDGKRKRLQLKETKDYIHVRGAQPTEPAKAGDIDDEMILKIVE